LGPGSSPPSATGEAPSGDGWQASNANSDINSFNYSVYARYTDPDANEDDVYRTDPQIENRGQQ
jgi:hypothetical protein